MKSWILEARDGSAATVTNSTLRASVPVSQVGDEAELGDVVAVCAPRILPGRSPGFLAIVGGAAPRSGSRPRQVRMYWNLRAEGAAAFVAECTERLGVRKVSYRLKLSNHPERYRRCDAATLYLDYDDYEAAQEPLRRLAESTAAWRDAAVPAFTLPLAPGVGLAENPEGTESFGQHRCRLTAEAIVEAHERGELGILGRETGAAHWATCVLAPAIAGQVAQPEDPC